jgi:hypothetical protein
MKIVQGDQIEWVRGLEHRGGTFHFRHLIDGEPGTVDNFSLSMGRNDKDFVSPRHRHNFDQFRFQLEGDLNFARDGKMTPGMVGFFPEGASYGPQTSEATAMTLVLQFGGASGSGYLSRQESKQATQELKQLGTFDDGVYRRNAGVPGKRNLDGFQAIWEHVNKRPLQFPKPRYPQPIMMDSAHYDWLPLAGHAGVKEKLLGMFTERRTEARMLLLARGASLRGSGRSIYFVTSGNGRIDGEPLRRFTAVFLDQGETATFVADTEIELLHLGMPDLRGLEATPDHASVAAE